MCPLGKARSIILVTPLCNVGLLASLMAVISYYTVNNKKKTVSFKNGAFLVRKIPYYFGVLFGSLGQGQYSPITERLICPSG